MKVNGLAYVNLGPDNGGIILDISEGGLCFQSSAPVKRTETVRFWFSYRGQRVESNRGVDRIEISGISRLIEVRSDLAWTDETLKRGGLRFMNLSATAREQIRDWIRQPALVHVNQGPVAGLFPSVRQSGTNLVRVASTRMEALILRMQSMGLWTGYSGGVVTGVAVSALLAGAIFLATHTRVVGDSLIQLGERLGGRSWSQTASPVAAVIAPQSNRYVPAEQAPDSVDRSVPLPDLEPAPVTEVPIQESGAEKHALPTAGPGEDKAAGTKPTRSPTANARVRSETRPLSELTIPALPSLAGADLERLSVPLVVGPAAAIDPSAGGPRTIAPPAVGGSSTSLHLEPSKTNGTTLGPEKFLEVGRFKERLLADGAITRLTRFGFPASVVPRSHLFSRTYQVLVGPYGTDPEAEAVHNDLAAKGFSPRSYERGKRDFTLPKGLQMNGKQLPAGFCVISWESYAPDAIVRFDNDRDSNVTLQGRWVKQSNKFPQDAVAYLRNADGTRTLVEIRFGGMAEALVFGPARN